GVGSGTDNQGMTSQVAHVLSVLSGGVHESYPDYTTDPTIILAGNYTVKNIANAAGFYNDLLFDKLAKLANDEKDIRQGLTRPIYYTHAAPGTCVCGNYTNQYIYIYNVTLTYIYILFLSMS